MAALGPLPNAHSRFSEFRGLTYHVASPPVGGSDDAGKYIAGRENEIASAALRYGGSAMATKAVHSRRRPPELSQALQSALDGRPRVQPHRSAPSAPRPPLPERQPQERIANLLCGAQKSPADTLRPADRTWFQRPLDQARPTSSAQMASWQTSHRAPWAASHSIRAPGYRAAPPVSTAIAPERRAASRPGSRHARDTFVEDL